MRSVLFLIVLFVIACSTEIEVKDDYPANIDTALIAHVKENGLERVMRAKRMCGCCGGCCGCGCMCGTGGPTGCPCMGCCG